MIFDYGDYLVIEDRLQLLFLFAIYVGVTFFTVSVIYAQVEKSAKHTLREHKKIDSFRLFTKPNYEGASLHQYNISPHVLLLMTEKHTLWHSLQLVESNQSLVVLTLFLQQSVKSEVDGEEVVMRYLVQESMPKLQDLWSAIRNLFPTSQFQFQLYISSEDVMSKKQKKRDYADVR